MSCNADLKYQHVMKADETYHELRTYLYTIMFKPDLKSAVTPGLRQRRAQKQRTAGAAGSQPRAVRQGNTAQQARTANAPPPPVAAPPLQAAVPLPAAAPSPEELAEFSHQFWSKAYEKVRVAPRPNLIYKPNHSKPPPPRPQHQQQQRAQQQPQQQHHPRPFSPPAQQTVTPLMSKRVPQPSRNDISRPQTRGDSSSLNPRCRLCLGRSHDENDCWARSSQCYQCQNIGHLSRACPYVSSSR